MFVKMKFHISQIDGEKLYISMNVFIIYHLSGVQCFPISFAPLKKIIMGFRQQVSMSTMSWTLMPRNENSHFCKMDDFLGKVLQYFQLLTDESQIVQGLIQPVTNNYN